MTTIALLGRTAGRTGLRAFARVSLTLGGTALVAFHLWLFAGRLRDLSIVEPRVLASWLASGALGLFALFLKRRGLPLVSGRSGLVFWLLVLLLHLGIAPTAGALPNLELTLALGFEVAAVVLAALALAQASDAGARLPRSLPFDFAVPGRAHALGACGPLDAPRPPPTR